MTNLFIIKIGGNIIDDDKKLSSFLVDYAAIKGKKILVHGGGKMATDMAAKLGLPQQMVDGRRITDIETLKVVTMVYAGLINKTIVAGLQSNNCQAVGLTGADGNSILAHKRNHPTIDYGFAGDVDSINRSFIQNLLEQNAVPVFAPITHNKKGQLLNTNADTIAQEIAKNLSSLYEVQLIYCFEKNGVLSDVNDEASVIAEINPTSYASLKKENKIFAGMIPKLDNAFAALQCGVRNVILGKAENLQQLLNATAGTRIIHE